MRVLQRGESLSSALLRSSVEDSREQALIHELCYGSLRWQHRLSALLGLLLDKPLRAKDTDVECLLRIGLYQLIYMRIPEHAAVHATVAVTAMLGKSWAKGLVNGVLRQFLRTADALLQQVDRKPAARYSHPGWLLSLLQKAYPQNWQDICEANNARAPMTLRINARKTTTTAYLQLLHEAGISAKQHPQLGSAVVLERPRDVQHLPGFAEGVVSVQDAAAQLATPLLACKTGMRVLDACAAPGGKTAQLLESVEDIEVTAIEIDAARIPRLRDTLERVGVQAVVMQADAGKPDEWWDSRQYHRILLDAPCSATGVIRRHPDIKVLKKAADIAELCRRQQQILQALWPLLAPGGMLLYCTCSVLPEENDVLIQRFVEEQDDAHLAMPEIQWHETHEWGLQILPGEYVMDGFYYARLVKQ